MREALSYPPCGYTMRSMYTEDYYLLCIRKLLQGQRETDLDRGTIRFAHPLKGYLCPLGKIYSTYIRSESFKFELIGESFKFGFKGENPKLQQLLVATIDEDIIASLARFARTVLLWKQKGHSCLHLPQLTRLFVRAPYGAALVALF